MLAVVLDGIGCRNEVKLVARYGDEKQIWVWNGPVSEIIGHVMSVLPQ